MKISGAIFDMDGTLTDSMYVWKDIGKKYLISCGITPRETLRSDIKNKSLVQTTDYFIIEYGLNKTRVEIIEGINSLVEPMYRDEVLPKKGVMTLLQKFKDKGIKMCVATATDRYLAELVLKKNGLLDFFSEIFTGSEVGAGKDNPLIFEKALEHLGTLKNETLVFEDALYAIKTAKNSGFKVVGVYDDHSKRNTDEIKAIADYYINDYSVEHTMFDVT